MRNLGSLRSANIFDNVGNMWLINPRFIEGKFVEHDNMMIKTRIGILLVILTVLSLFFSCCLGSVVGMESNSSDEAEPEDEFVDKTEKEPSDMGDIGDTDDTGDRVSEASQDITLVPKDGSIQKPTWEVGDRWSMGNTMNMVDSIDDLRKSLESTNSKIDRLKLEGEIGIYQSAEVQAKDVPITIGSSSYNCYEIYFEQYLGLVVNADIGFEMTVPDYLEEEYYEEYEESEEYSYNEKERISESESSYISSEQTRTITLREKGYVWANGDITGHIYYTMDNLAVAKCDMSLLLDGELDISVTGSVEGEGTLAMLLSYDIDSVNARSEVRYDPPLNIFDFPIEPEEYWTASSMMTETLTELSGSISYDMLMDVPDVPATTMKDSIDLGSEVTTPDTYGPVKVTYNFYNSGIKEIDLINGIRTECLVIEPDNNDEWYYDDYDYEDYEEYDEYDEYYYDEEPSGGDGSDWDMEDEMVIKEGYTESSFSVMPSSIPFMGESIESDFEAESMYNPIESGANSVSYYSEDEGNIVSYEPPEESPISGIASSTSPYSSTQQKTTVTPKTYNEVTDFTTKERSEKKNKYPRSSGSSTDNDLDVLTILMMGITAVFVIFLIIALVVRSTHKKPKMPRQRYNTPPQYQQHTAPPGADADGYPEERYYQPSLQTPPQTNYRQRDQQHNYPYYNDPARQPAFKPEYEPAQTPPYNYPDYPNNPDYPDRPY